MKKIILYCVIIYCLVGMTGCEHKKKIVSHKPQLIVATEQTPVRQLFFSGTLAPISAVAVESPVTGIVSTMGFTYGERVKEGQSLFTIASHELAENYRKAIGDYLLKKQTYETQKTGYAGEQVLYKAGVVSRNDYENTKSQYENASLSYLESRYALEKILRTANVDSKEIEVLSLAETDRVNAIMQRHFHDVTVAAPKAGVALYPQPKTGSDGATSDGKLSVGSLIKEGQLLISIGDLSGLSAIFNVSEVDINSIKQGMPVIVTGSAFPGIALKGVVSSVSAQANQGGAGDSSALSMFAVGVTMPQVDVKSLAHIRVGMTAKFEIDIRSAPQIMLPVNAVFQSKGQNMVRIQDATGNEHSVPVVTGETSPTQIVIVSGVKAGDKVVVPGL
ncbi:MAG: efflux RND transporter periplasmic adaptor subunit [Coxiellaceae bacterium]|nr:efflux RND transporter periplasmic adaptor subunit [Coxiellaceae bacterium]